MSPCPLGALRLRHAGTEDGEILFLTWDKPQIVYLGKESSRWGSDLVHLQVTPHPASQNCSSHHPKIILNITGN